MNASTFTARVIASTGADVAAALSGAIGAMSGPLHGGAPARVLPMIEEVEQTGDARRPGQAASSTAARSSWASATASTGPRTRAPGCCAAPARSSRRRATRSRVALEQAALTELRERRPDHPIETNVEFWAAVILDFAEVPPHMMPAMFTSARTAGWSAHILEQKREAKLVRPSAQYIGPGPRGRPRTSRAGTTSSTTRRPRPASGSTPVPGRRPHGRRTSSDSPPASTHSPPPTNQASVVAAADVAQIARAERHRPPRRPGGRRTPSRTRPARGRRRAPGTAPSWAGSSPPSPARRTR